ncbi:hypothetical protein [Sphingobium yanoikuyae]|uniref:hypothetical protein n=1 Tax=Sphingobium yanoikuyae TaxID=13690 RepID=UPI00345EDF6A
MIRLFLPLLMLGVGPVAVVEEPMPTDALMRTLAEGDLAQARGDQAALAAAADTLKLLGARPRRGRMTCPPSGRSRHRPAAPSMQGQSIAAARLAPPIVAGLWRPAGG